MRHAAVIAAIAVCASGAVRAEAPKRAIRIAVRPMEASPDDARLGRVLDDALVAEMRKLKGASVIGLDEVKAMLDLEAQKQLTGCTEASCIAEIASALGADVLIIGQIAMVNGERIFGLKRIDQQTATVVNEVNLKLVDDGGNECLASVGQVVEKLFPELPLREGEERGVSDAIALRLHPPPLSPIVPITGFAITGVALAGTLVAVVANAVVALNLSNDVANASAKDPLVGSKYVEQNRIVGATFAAEVIGGAVTVGLGAASLVSAIWLTDWAGSDEEDAAAP